jgi:hypothetical protein
VDWPALQQQYYRPNVFGTLSMAGAGKVLKCNSDHAAKVKSHDDRKLRARTVEYIERRIDPMDHNNHIDVVWHGWHEMRDSLLLSVCTIVVRVVFDHVRQHVWSRRE